MGTTYCVKITVKYTLDIEVPDEEVAKGAENAAAYAIKHGRSVWEDDAERTTYADEPVEEVTYIATYPKEKSNV